ncbi:heme A synthase [uncultured Tessaracoccus sp.]|uniref:COX15/CtaA family protein n=1 Tax=uncultured Tessaracoccus sp. TaxID=905023 RepID=UPI00263362C6|nr:COX15/CtaA family protein [uncultured Tessaracoccus sp.]
MSGVRHDEQEVGQVEKGAVPGAVMRAVFVAAAIVTFAAVALGSVVCATDSSAACPNWPGCYVGQIAPEAQLNPILEFVHRVVAVSCGPLLLAAAIVGLRVKDPLVRVLPWVAFVGAMIAGVLGMLTVKVGISKAWAAFDLGASLIALVAITVATVCVLRYPRRWQPGATGRLAWGAVGALFAFHICSVLVAGSGSLTRCMSWPVWRVIEADGSAAWQWARLVLGGVAAVLTVLVAVQGLRRRDTRVFGAVLTVLVVCEVAMGLTVVAHGADLRVKAWYAALAAATFCVSVWVASLASVAKR